MKPDPDALERAKSAKIEPIRRINTGNILDKLTPRRYRVLIQTADEDNFVKLIASILICQPELNPYEDFLVTASFPAPPGWEGSDWVMQDAPWSPAREWNKLLLKIGGSDAILVGDDVVLRTANGFRHLANLAREIKAIITPSVAGERRTAPYLKTPYLHPVPEIQQIKWCPFFCVAIPNELLRLVSFDERYTGYGCEDHDFHFEAALQGYPLYVTRNVVVLHDSGDAGRSVAMRDQKLRQEGITRNGELFFKKWGCKPP